MNTNAMVPPVTLKGAPVPVERTAQFSPHRFAGDGVRTNTPAAVESARVLASRSRAALRTARPFERPTIPA